MAIILSGDRCVLCLLGVQALAVERAVLKADVASEAAWSERSSRPIGHPGACSAAGAVVVLYSFTIPRRVNGS